MFSGRSKSDNTVVDLKDSSGGPSSPPADDVGESEDSSTRTGASRAHSASSLDLPSQSVAAAPLGRVSTRLVGPNGVPKDHTLKEVMSDAAKKDFFRRFLESEHADENLTFCNAVEHYRSIADAAARLVEAKSMVLAHIDEDAPQQVHLPVACIRALREHMERGDAPVTLFDDARMEILNTLEADKLASFTESMLYAAMCSGLDNKEALAAPIVFQTFLKLCLDDGPALWKKVTKVFKKGLPDDESIILKSRLEFPLAASVVGNVLFDNDMHKTRYDSKCNSCVVLHRFDENFVVYRQSHRFRKGPRASLDSYSVDGYMRSVDAATGDVTLIYRSLAWPGEGSPVFVDTGESSSEGAASSAEERDQQPAVEVKVLLSGYHVRNTGPNSCVVTKLNQMHFAGTNMSTADAKVIASDRSKMLSGLRDYMVKLYNVK